MLMNHAALGIVVGVAWFVQKVSGLPLLAVVYSPQVAMPGWMVAARVITLGAVLPIFLILLRVLPLSGYHAAEHQVVHAIENGEPLSREKVSAMPRVHPRCGTNIVAAVIVFLIVTEASSSEIAALVAVFLMMFAWRAIGGYFQYYVTTKPPSPKQLDSGIRAGIGLLDQYRRNPAHRVTGLQRIWNSGMPQVMLGVAAVLVAGQLAHVTLPGMF